VRNASLRRPSALITASRAQRLLAGAPDQGEIFQLGDAGLRRQAIAELSVHFEPAST
jgi:hypothetical protein